MPFTLRPMFCRPTLLNWWKTLLIHKPIRLSKIPDELLVPLHHISACGTLLWFNDTFLTTATCTTVLQTLFTLCLCHLLINPASVNCLLAQIESSVYLICLYLQSNHVSASMNSKPVSSNLLSSWSYPFSRTTFYLANLIYYVANLIYYVANLIYHLADPIPFLAPSSIWLI